MATASAKDKLLDAALRVIRTKGYAATSVDALCAEAGVTKGAFFHHFDSKDELAIAAADHWSTMTGGLFASAPYHAPKDPLDRVLGYVRFRKELLRGELPDFTCLIGTIVQEAYQNERIRGACKASIFGHAETLEADIAAAKKLYAPHAKWSVSSLALYTQASIQGAFIVAKASGDMQDAARMIEHLENYVRLLFPR